MDNIKIIKLDPSRWQEYKQIRLEALKDAPQAFLVSYAESLTRPDDKWQKSLSDGDILVFAENNGKLVGMTGADREKWEQSRHVVMIWGVYVSPKYRGQKIGQKLMEAVIDQIKLLPGIVKIKLWVNANQKPAWDLYKKLGFKESGRAEKELKIGDKYYDEILLEMLI